MLVTTTDAQGEVKVLGNLESSVCKDLGGLVDAIVLSLLCIVGINSWCVWKPFLHQLCQGGIHHWLISGR